MSRKKKKRKENNLIIENYLIGSFTPFSIQILHFLLNVNNKKTQ